MSSSQAAILVFFSLADFSWFRAAHQRVFKIVFLIISEAQPCNRIDFLFFSCYFNKYEMLSRSISISKRISYTVGKEIPYLRAPMYYSLKLYNFFHRFLKIGIT